MKYNRTKFSYQININFYSCKQKNYKNFKGHSRLKTNFNSKNIFFNNSISTGNKIDHQINLRISDHRININQSINKHPFNFENKIQYIKSILIWLIGFIGKHIVKFICKILFQFIEQKIGKEIGRILEKNLDDYLSKKNSNNLSEFFNLVLSDCLGEHHYKNLVEDIFQSQIQSFEGFSELANCAFDFSLKQFIEDYYESALPNKYENFIGNIIGEKINNIIQMYLAENKLQLLIIVIVTIVVYIFFNLKYILSLLYQNIDTEVLFYRFTRFIFIKFFGLIPSLILLKISSNYIKDNLAKHLENNFGDFKSKNIFKTDFL